MSQLPTEITGRAPAGVGSTAQIVPRDDPEFVASRLVYSMQALNDLLLHDTPGIVIQLFKQLEKERPTFTWESFENSLRFISFAERDADRNHGLQHRNVGGHQNRYHPEQQSYSRVEALQILFYDKLGTEIRRDFLKFPDYLSERLEKLGLDGSKTGIQLRPENADDEIFKIANQKHMTGRLPFSPEEEYYALTALRNALSHRLFMIDNSLGAPASGLNPVAGAHARDYRLPKVIDLDALARTIPTFIESLADVKRLGILAETALDKIRSAHFGYGGRTGFPRIGGVE